MQVTKDIASGNQEESELLLRVSERDHDALTQLFLIYHPRLFKFVFRLTHSYSIADELVNDIMLVVWKKAASFRGDSKVSTWIFGIAYRLTMRRVTQKQIHTTQLEEAENIAGENESALETEDWVLSGIYALPAAQQLAVVLVFYLGLSYEETAEIAQCPVNTIKTRMFHARRKLKELLAIAAGSASISGESGHG
ncbi:MAG: RNA polymerase sigma-70 factor (ECF subfamily) [Woeseiaceae bacterium]|jgi:RNA polymerase sigma-70 factor (ECF subfamily)